MDILEIDTNIGRSDLKRFAHKNDYQTIQVNYSNIKSTKNYSEVCVYDTSIMEIL